MEYIKELEVCLGLDAKKSFKMQLGDVPKIWLKLLYEEYISYNQTNIEGIKYFVNWYKISRI